MISLLLLLLLQTAVAVKYKAEIKIPDETYAGTNDNIFLTIHGTHGSTSPYLCDTAWYDNFEPGYTDEFEFFRYEDVGDILCVTLTTAGTDHLLVHHVAVAKEVYGTPDNYHYMFNKERVKLTNANYGQPSLKICEDDCYRYLPVDSNWILEDMQYDTERGIAHPTNTVEVGKLIVDARDSSTAQASSIELASTISNKMSYTHSQGQTVSNTVTFSVRIPKVVSGSIQVSESRSSGNSFTKVSVVTESVSFTFPCRAAAGTKVKCVAYQEKYQMEVPYEQTWKHKTQKCRYHVKGVANIDSDASITLEVDEI